MKMGAVQIKNVRAIAPDAVSKIRGHLASNYPEKYVVMYEIGISTGLRISDILNLKVKDIKPKGFYVIEKKTGKNKWVQLSKQVLSSIEGHKERNGLKESDYLVYSREDAKGAPLTRIQAYRVLKAVSETLNLDDIGTHSMRKTYACLHYQKYHDLAFLQQQLNHKYMSTTLMYLIRDIDFLSKEKEKSDVKR